MALIRGNFHIPFDLYFAVSNDEAFREECREECRVVKDFSVHHPSGSSVSLLITVKYLMDFSRFI